jgi:hypothetical protein
MRGIVPAVGVRESRSTSDLQLGGHPAGTLWASTIPSRRFVIPVSWDIGSGVEFSALNHTVFFLAAILSATGLYGQRQAVLPSASVPDTSIRLFEVGGQTATIGLKNCGWAQKGCDQFGGGAGVVLNLNQHFAIDSSFITMRGMPAGSIGDPYDPSAAEPLAGGCISEFLAGVRIGSRAKRWGVFARVSPGVMSWKTGTIYGSINDFVIESGVGVEYSPAPRVHLRAEYDELSIKYHEFAGGHCYPCFGAGWTANDEVKAGAYWSMGKPVNWAPVNTHAKPTRRFFEVANIALLTADALSVTADDITTERNLHEGGQEGNPLSRPFVRNGWPGLAGQAVLWESVKVGLMYGAHRLHMHWLEKAVPLCDMYEHAKMAHANAQQE